MMWRYCSFCHTHMTDNPEPICDHCGGPQKKSRRWVGTAVAALCLIGVALLVGWPS